VSLKNALGRAREILAGSGIEDAPLEAELLLKYALKISRTQLYTELERQLSPKEEQTFWRLVEHRRSGEPTAYITKSREFYGLDFYVDHRVLIPRPESELLVETALKIAQKHRLSTIADIGTGCGAIAVSLALELPQAKIYATDISAPALEVALVNCRKHGVADRVQLLQGDMLEPLPEPVELIVANLPYVRESELNPLRFEPRLALDGGAGGTASIGRLCRQAGTKLKSGGSLLLEIGQGQKSKVTALLQRFFPEGEIEVTTDLSGIERVISLSLSARQSRVAR
jgi:release factor glutamine methyltransferase